MPFRRFIAHVRNPLLRRFWLKNSIWYWQVRKLAASAKFRLHRRAFVIKAGVAETRDKCSIIWEILFRIACKAAIAVGSVAILVAIEKAFPLLSEPFNWKIEPDAEYSFLATMSQVSATMLGLYFTAVSLVASTAYARVPGNVRAMIVEEQVGNFYFAFLAHFAATSVVMLATVSLGVPIGVLNTLWLSFLGLFGLFSFVILGLRTFSFFDPTALVRHLNPRLARVMLEVTPAGYKWFDPSFQNHQQREADRAIEAYANLVTIAEQSENLNARTLVELAEGLLAALNHYARMKGRVPSKSLWFRRCSKHKQWLLAPSHELQVARATDTSLGPEMVPDLNWFETDVSQVLARIIARLCARSNLTGLITVLSAGQQYSRNAAAFGCAEEALLLSSAMGREIDKAFAQATFDSTSSDSLAQSLNRLNALDLHALGLMNVLLGASHALETTDCSAFEQQITRIKWNKPASLYTENLPRTVLEQCEEMQNRLLFEQEVEGKIVTPAWLQLEIAALGNARFLARIIERILAEFEARFGETVEQRVKVEDCIGAVLLINRGLEATNKLSAHLKRIHAYWNKLLELNRSKDWEWPAINWDDISKRRTALRDRQVGHLAGCITALIDLPDQKEVPDFFGQAYSVLADSCFDALIRGDEAMFTAIFPPYFLTAIQAHQKVRSALGKITNNNLNVTFGPLSDLLAISGFAELYSALTSKKFSVISRKIWDSYFDSLPDDASRKTLIGMLGLTKESSLMRGISSREIMRQQWRRATCDHLNAQGLSMREYRFGSRPQHDAHHPSPLVRAFIARGDMLNDPEDVFLAMYLFARPEAAELKVPYQVESYQRALAQEEGDNEIP